MPALDSFLLVAIHWKSLMWRTKGSQDGALFELSRMIMEVEKARGHDRTVVIGDLNSEPYYDGMISSSGMHAVMSRAVASRGSREVSPFGASPFFYNPMWSLYGDESDGPPGTYFRQGTEELTQFWHVFDQVLVRPALVPLLPKKSVQVPTAAGTISLISASGVPTASDHFPLIFDFGIPIL
jgi:endonuclease/exonuclease/phosphatase family metal-dependent hydrolase